MLVGIKSRKTAKANNYSLQQFNVTLFQDWAHISQCLSRCTIPVKLYEAVIIKLSNGFCVTAIIFDLLIYVASFQVRYFRGIIHLAGGKI